MAGSRIKLGQLKRLVFESKTNNVARMVSKCPLIDAAGPGRKVYQVTVSEDHSMVYSSMKELLI